MMNPVQAGGTNTTTLGTAIARGRGWSAIERESASILNERGAQRTRHTRVRIPIRSSRCKGKGKTQDRDQSIIYTITFSITVSSRSRGILGTMGISSSSRLMWDVYSLLFNHKDHMATLRLGLVNHRHRHCYSRRRLHHQHHNRTRSTPATAQATLHPTTHTTPAHSGSTQQAAPPPPPSGSSPSLLLTSAQPHQQPPYQ